MPPVKAQLVELINQARAAQQASTAYASTSD